MTTTRTIAQWAAIGVAGLIGVLLLIVSPFMLLLGAWGGSDSGSVAGGIAALLGLPWLIYLVSTTAMGFLLRWRWTFAGLVIALCQTGVAVWIGRIFVH